MKMTKNVAFSALTCHLNMESMNITSQLRSVCTFPFQSSLSGQGGRLSKKSG